VAVLGVILSAVYMLWMFQRVNYGTVTHEENASLPDLSRREAWVIVPTVAVAVLMGVFPGLFLKPMQPSVERLLQRVSREAVAEAPAPGVSRAAADAGAPGAPPAPENTAGR
ncbi:MAG: nuoM 2, partial [Acidobacteria bacterium]|nr:nuoM 2 [Acidobacteriota bacterium]